MTGGLGYLAGRVGLQDLDNEDKDSATPTDQQPLPCIKLKMFGHCGVGKTTLVDSLRCGYLRALFRQLTRSKERRRGHPQGQTSVKDMEEGIVSSHETCTRCVDVQRINISGNKKILQI